jgi:flagellar motility protein MotE (MotC chaperone)
MIWALLGLLTGCGEALGQTWGGDPPAATKASSQSPGLQQLADALETRERSLERREATLEAREAELRQVETELQAQVGELETLRGEIQTLLEQADGEREERVQALVKMTESMRSKDAAALLAEVDPDLAVEVLDRMNRTKAGKALAAMPPPTAAALAEDLTRPPLEGP